MFKQYNKKLKKYFIVGLITIFPIWFVLIILIILFKWISNFSFYLISYLFNDIHCLSLRILCFVISILSIIIVGIIISIPIIKTIITIIETIIKKIPIIGSLHLTAKQFINCLFVKNPSKQFKKVVLIPYPNSKNYSVAFVTGEQKIKEDIYLSIFMPTTPNPTTGFLLFFKEENVLYTDYTVEQAFKLIISIGIISMDKKNDI
jgi:uncharacterized membrane protein